MQRKQKLCKSFPFYRIFGNCIILLDRRQRIFSTEISIRFVLGAWDTTHLKGVPFTFIEPKLPIWIKGEITKSREQRQLVDFIAKSKKKILIYTDKIATLDLFCDASPICSAIWPCYFSAVSLQFEDLPI